MKKEAHRQQQCEMLLAELLEIADTNGCDLFESVSFFCKKHEMDIESFIELIDENIKERLRSVAIKQRMVRSSIFDLVNELPLK